MGPFYKRLGGPSFPNTTGRTPEVKPREADERFTTPYLGVLSCFYRRGLRERKREERMAKRKGGFGKQGQRLPRKQRRAETSEASPSWHRGPWWTVIWDTEDVVPSPCILE